MNELLTGEGGGRIRATVLTVLILLAVFLGVKTLGELKSLRYIGAGLGAGNTISVSGYGESFAAADVAEFSFTVAVERSTVAAAQTEVTQRADALTAYLKEQGIEERDIKTTTYTVYPQYDYRQVQCVAYPCPGQQVLRGYEVRQTTSVKVRDTAKAGDLLSGVGSRGATEVSGLAFTFDDPDALQAQAREEAIADAKEKAEALARQLGVRLVRIVSFNESGYGGPVPLYRAEMALDNAAGSATAPSANISVGENKVTSNVSVTYEIR